MSVSDRSQKVWFGRTGLLLRVLCRANGLVHRRRQNRRVDRHADDPRRSGFHMLVTVFATRVLVITRGLFDTMARQAGNDTRTRSAAGTLRSELIGEL